MMKTKNRNVVLFLLSGIASWMIHPNPVCTGTNSITTIPVRTLRRSRGGQLVQERMLQETCGKNVCDADSFCCNESCSICARRDGGFCNRMYCSDGGLFNGVGNTNDEQTCGNNICSTGEYCCNESCGICALEGSSCITMVCNGSENDAMDRSNTPTATTVSSDEPSYVPLSDVPSIVSSDAPSYVPSDAPSVVSSTNPSDVVSDYVSEEASDAPSDASSEIDDNNYDDKYNDDADDSIGDANSVFGKVCGPSQELCPAGQYCCNESCGICSEIGKGCLSTLVCGEDGDIIEVGNKCGNVVCGSGEYCCNRSCSICSPLNGSCIMEFCNED